MLRCGYSGNHLTTSKIIESGNVASLPTFSVSDDGYIVISGSGNGRALFIVNKPE
jgi:hypothetical protein